MSPVVVAMGVVIAGWVLLVLTSASAELNNRGALRMIVMVVWLLIVTTGWAVFAYLAYGTPGGLDGAWQWANGQPLVMRIAMWVFLLPYMGGLGIWQLAWVVSQKTVAICALAVATFLLSLKRG
ncbi:MAG: hypothetical protein Q7J82_09955 [Coriobacteriia bacterium]|nr:hypothetical protein [Coriobacteriia bacterium]